MKETNLQRYERLGTRAWKKGNYKTATMYSILETKERLKSDCLLK